ncbi:MAG TPA: 4-(cytidine 5'-diphospho)-2-C-methyl-D-erythritol kinase [Candidatus Obscuribacterales bacterium]
MSSATIDQVAVLAPAKINLTLDVLGTLPDGYHEIVTLFQSVDLQDELLFSFLPNSKFAIDIQCEFAGTKGVFPLDHTNLIAKAAHAFLQRSRLNPSLKILVEVKKRIPIGAGLAGGSADAAATLIACNEYFNSPMTGDELKYIAKSLGADVPFCLTGGIQLGTHKGDVLTPYSIPERLFFILIKPRQISISTPWVYREFDEWQMKNKQQPEGRPDAEGAIAHLLRGDLECAIHCFGNVFEPMLFAHYPALRDIRDYLLRLGCWYAQLSGSGPSIFAITPDREMSHFVRRRIQEDELRGNATWQARAWQLDCFIVESLDHGSCIMASPVATSNSQLPAVE